MKSTTQRLLVSCRLTTIDHESKDREPSERTGQRISAGWIKIQWFLQMQPNGTSKKEKFKYRNCTSKLHGLVKLLKREKAMKDSNDTAHRLLKLVNSKGEIIMSFENASAGA